MIWNPKRGVPTQPHFSRGLASAEAERLARKNPGEEFVVLEGVEVFAVDLQPVSRRPLTDPSDEMPF